MNLRKLLPSTVLVFAAATAWATATYEYGANEYVTVVDGLSPDGRLAITTHGEGELGMENFRLYLFDAVSGKKLGPLEEINETLDSAASAYGVRWKPDSGEATIVYRRDRHVPIKAMTYRFAKGRAIPATRRPVDLHDNDLPLIQFWQERCATASATPGRTFGTPKAHP